jgi:hypothetical protein
MLAKYPNLYGDNSALAGLSFRLRPSALRRLVSAEMEGRILHGSDLPVPSSGLLTWAFGMLPWTAFRSASAIPNPLERDARLKRMLGFGESSFLSAARILRAA